MKIASAVLALLLVAAPAVQADPVDAKIIGGETVAESGAVVGIYYSGEFFCTASVIGPRWALTAKHCAEGDPPDNVMVGSVKAGEGTRVDVVRGDDSPSSDMTLLELAADVPAPYMPLADSEPAVGETHQIYGWGTFEVGEGPLSPVLKRAAVDVIGSAKDYFGGPAVQSTWNTGTAGFGDSGGPQVNADGVQVGVCSTGDYVNVEYASVAANRSWIRSVSGV